MTLLFSFFHHILFASSLLPFVLFFLYLDAASIRDFFELSSSCGFCFAKIMAAASGRHWLFFCRVFLFLVGSDNLLSDRVSLCDIAGTSGVSADIQPTKFDYLVLRFVCPY